MAKSKTKKWEQLQRYEANSKAQKILKGYKAIDTK
jgi:hypothetical protein